VLYLTYCSGKKKPVKFGTPANLYNSKRITDFISICSSKGYEYAVLSAKYGLFFPDEINENYNVTFKSITYDCRFVEDGVLLSKEMSLNRFEKLVQQVRRSIRNRDVDRVVFYSRPPLMRRKCYLKVLHTGVDNCLIDHRRWYEIVNHVNELYKEGNGKIKIVSSLRNL
jgi:hypothetical protein